MHAHRDCIISHFWLLQLSFPSYLSCLLVGTLLSFLALAVTALIGAVTDQAEAVLQVDVLITAGEWVCDAEV